MDYLIVKWIHIVSSTVLFGTGIGTAFSLVAAHHSRQVPVIAGVARNVVWADWVFTTPAVIIQPVTGLFLGWRAGFPLFEGWLGWSWVLYFIAGACWLPVLWLQTRMKDLAAEAVREGTPLPADYWRYARIWTALGFPAFFALMIVFYLMVAKPVMSAPL